MVIRYYLRRQVKNIEKRLQLLYAIIFYYYEKTHVVSEKKPKIKMASRQLMLEKTANYPHENFFQNFIIIIIISKGAVKKEVEFSFLATGRFFFFAQNAFLQGTCTKLPLQKRKNRPMGMLLYLVF